MARAKVGRSVYCLLVIQIRLHRGDFLQFTNTLRLGTTEEVRDGLRALEHKLSIFGRDVESYAPRSEITVVVGLLLKRSSREVARMTEAVPSHADLMAWSMRNLFELWVVCSTIIQSNDEMRRWIAQTVADEIQVLEAARTWMTHSPERCREIEACVAHLRTVCNDLSLDPAARPFNIERLATKLNRQDEYQVMFKLSSKFVHPSAVLVNERLKSDDSEYANIFLIRGQEYASQLLTETTNWFGLWAAPVSGGAI